MEESKIREVTLRERRTEKDISILTASISDDGDLVLEGYDLGDAPKRFWGDDDYEYWRVIKKDYKDAIVHRLREEKFDTDADFRLWLGRRNIPCGRDQVIRDDYKDTILLLLIKDRFSIDSDFKAWLDTNGIPSQFDSWV